ncbi:MAG: hypothetical protein CM15mV101_150 [uncultured marine virus]|nr:MAG: hypothetical protein CM15mV101_150 [uncultured marine virus]
METELLAMFAAPALVVIVSVKQKKTITVTKHRAC